MNLLIVSDSDFILRRIMADVRLYTEADIFTLKWHQRDSVSYPGVQFDATLISVQQLNYEWINRNSRFFKSVLIDSDRLKNAGDGIVGCQISFAHDLYHKLMSI
ncbi:MAG: hypothetical protein Kow00108_19550 [Calditrichia bacterium]